MKLLFLGRISINLHKAKLPIVFQYQNLFDVFSRCISHRVRFNQDLETHLLTH